MKCLLSGLLVLAMWQSQPVRREEPTPVSGGAWLMQQPSEQAAIDSTLAALRQGGASPSRLGEQLARAMISLTDKDHRPPWPLVAVFTDNLTRELVGKQLSNTQNAGLRECLFEAMRPTGTSNTRLASRLQEILADARINSEKTQHILGDFIKLRESVRGPDDLPARESPRTPF